MTKNETKNEVKDDIKTSEEEVVVKPPGAGWDRVNPEDGERNYAYLQAGVIWQGLLVGRFQRNDRPNAYYYQIRLSEPVAARTKDGEIIQAQKGDVLTIDERTALLSLRDVTERDGKYEVWIRVIEKVIIGGGKSFWRMDVMSRRA